MNETKKQRETREREERVTEARAMIETSPPAVRAAIELAGIGIAMCMPASAAWDEWTRLSLAIAISMGQNARDPLREIRDQLSRSLGEAE